MKKLLSFLSMVLLSLNQVFCAGLINMDSDDALNAQVKAEALRNVLPKYPKLCYAMGPEYAYSYYIYKDDLMNNIYASYAQGGELTLGLILNSCLNNACSTKCNEGFDEQQHITTNGGVVCMDFILSVVQEHNYLVSKSVMPYGKLTEQEFEKIIESAQDCPVHQFSVFTNKYDTFAKECRETCRHYATEHICKLHGNSFAFREDRYEQGCGCNDGDVAWHFVPTWKDYKKLGNIK